MGFIAVALVYFGGWKASGVLAGSLLYGLVTAVITKWKTLGIVTGAAASLTTMAPAVLTVLALAVIARRTTSTPLPHASVYKRRLRQKYYLCVNKRFEIFLLTKLV